MIEKTQQSLGVADIGGGGIGISLFSAADRAPRSGVAGSGRTDPAYPEDHAAYTVETINARNRRNRAHGGALEI